MRHSKTWTLPSLIWTKSYPTNGLSSIREATRRWEALLEENKDLLLILQTPWETPQLEVVLVEVETFWTPVVEDSRTGFRIDSRTSNKLIIMAVLEVDKMNQVLLVKKIVLRSLDKELDWVNSNSNSNSNNKSNKMLLCREDNSTGALVLLEAFPTNHSEIGWRVSRVISLQVVPQLLLNQGQDLPKLKEHQEEVLEEAVQLIKTCRRGLPIWNRSFMDLEIEIEKNQCMKIKRNLIEYLL